MDSDKTIAVPGSDANLRVSSVIAAAQMTPNWSNARTSTAVGHPGVQRHPVSAGFGSEVLSNASIPVV